MTIDINELRRLALDGDLAAMQEIILRLEAAERGRDNANAAAVNIALEAERLQCENDALRVALRHEADCLEAAKAEIDALCAKIAQMEIDKREISEAHNAVTRRLSVLADENTALRAKIEAMEQQGPVAEWLPLDSGEDTRRG